MTSRLGAKNEADLDKDPKSIPESERDYYLERLYRVRQSGAARHRFAPREGDVRQGKGVGPKWAVCAAACIWISRTP